MQRSLLHRDPTRPAMTKPADSAPTATPRPRGRASDAARFARMAGSSIAAPSAAGWVTDFLNAAYFARPEADRDVRDLRLAYGIVTTRWVGLEARRLRGRDVVAFNRAFGRLRLARGGRLDNAALLDGASRLLGGWFPEAWEDEPRRAHGAAFATVAERDAFTPERRLRHAALGPLNPPLRAAAHQHWATYDPVELLDPRSALGLLRDPARWTDMGCASGRFTALRSGGLLGQTFEIEVVAQPSRRLPVFTRGYVTCTTALLNGAASDLRRAVDELRSRYQAGAGKDAPAMLPPGAEPLALIVLTTHAGHFLGSALSHLLVWQDARGTWIRDIGAWDPLPTHLAAAYRAAGRAAQRAFWGPAHPARSMLAQLAAVRGGARDSRAGRPGGTTVRRALDHKRIPPVDDHGRP
jgi:hypothetical protein